MDTEGIFRKFEVKITLMRRVSALEVSTRSFDSTTGCRYNPTTETTKNEGHFDGNRSTNSYIIKKTKSN